MKMLIFVKKNMWFLFGFATVSEKEYQKTWSVSNMCWWSYFWKSYRKPYQQARPAFIWFISTMKERKLDELSNVCISSVDFCWYLIIIFKVNLKTRFWSWQKSTTTLCGSFYVHLILSNIIHQSDLLVISRVLIIPFCWVFIRQQGPILYDF